MKLKLCIFLLMTHLSSFGQGRFSPYIQINGEIYKDGSRFFVKSLTITAQTSDRDTNTKTISFATEMLSNGRSILKIEGNPPGNLSGKLITFSYRIDNASSLVTSTAHKIESALRSNSSRPDPARDNTSELGQILTHSSGINILDKVTSFVSKN